MAIIKPKHNKNKSNINKTIRHTLNQPFLQIAVIVSGGFKTKKYEYR